MRGSGPAAGRARLRLLRLRPLRRAGRRLLARRRVGLLVLDEALEARLLQQRAAGGAGCSGRGAGAGPGGGAGATAGAVSGSVSSWVMSRSLATWMVACTSPFFGSQ